MASKPQVDLIVSSMAARLNGLLPQVAWKPPVNFAAWFLGKKLNYEDNFRANRFNQRGVEPAIVFWVLQSHHDGIFPSYMAENERAVLLQTIEDQYANKKGDPFVTMLGPLDTPQRAQNWICNAWVANYNFCKDYGLIQDEETAKESWRTIAVDNLNRQLDAVRNSKEPALSPLSWASPDEEYKITFDEAYRESRKIAEQVTGVQKQ